MQELPGTAAPSKPGSGRGQHRAERRRRRSLVAAAILLSCLGCRSYEPESTLELTALWCAFYGPPGTPSTETWTVSDLGTGIVQLTQQVVGGLHGRCTANRNPSFTQLYYAQKCLLGQTYRSANNDCRGAGTAGDNWGADSAKQQFCTSNDASCETNGAATAPTSPAAQACSAVTAGGHTWRLPRRGEFFETTTSVLESLHSLTPEIPLNLEWWTSSQFSPTQAHTRQKQSASAWLGQQRSKTDSYHLWCFATGTITYQ